jgi:hypothetical protein
MEASIFIIFAFGFLISMVWLFNNLIKKLETPNIDWKDKNEIPGEIAIDRNISKDVLICDLDHNEIYLGYYSYSNSSWVLCSKNTIFLTNFVWAYINH